MAPFSGQLLNLGILFYLPYNLNSTFKSLQPTQPNQFYKPQHESLPSQAQEGIAGLRTKMRRTKAMIVKA